MGVNGGLVEKSDLHCVACESLPVHIDAMPTIQINGAVVSMAYFSASKYFGVSNHSTPYELLRLGVLCNQLLVCGESESDRIPLRNHYGNASGADEFLAHVRFTAIPPAERLVSQDLELSEADSWFWNEEPLSLPNGLGTDNLVGSKAIDRGTDVTNAFTWYSGSEPVTLVSTQQVFVFGIAIADHQYQMVAGRTHVENFGFNLIHATKFEELAPTILDDVNDEFLPLA